MLILCRYPDLNLVYNTSSTTLSAKINHEYYPAFGSSVIATDNEVFVWGSRPLKDPSFGKACMFYAVAGNNSVRDGPCLESYGEGENPEDISLSSDGLVILLTAGFKVAVHKRASIDSPFQQAFNFTFGVVVNFASLSADGRSFVCSCDDGVCSYKEDASGSYTRSWSIASVDGFHFEEAALSTGSDSDSLVVALMNNEDSTQW